MNPFEWSTAVVWRVVQLGSLLWMGLWWGWCRWLGWPVWVAVLGVLWVLALPGVSLAWQGVVAARTARQQGLPPLPAGVRLWAWAVEWAWCLRVFGWQMPWRAQACPDTVQSSPQRGVLLLHGHGCNRAFWLPWMRRLRARGVPYASVSLQPMLGDIDGYVPAVDAALQRLTALTGQAPLVLAHSKGGLVLRAWWRWARAQALQQGQDEAQVLARVHAVITLGSPHQGSVLAQGMQLPFAQQMQPGSAWLQAVAAAESPAWRARFLCVASDADSVVFPASAAELPGAATRRLAGLAHVQLAFDPQVQVLVWQAWSAEPNHLPC
jgi:triacylglycerol lipase